MIHCGEGSRERPATVQHSRGTILVFPGNRCDRARATTSPTLDISVGQLDALPRCSGNASPRHKFHTGSESATEARAAWKKIFLSPASASSSPRATLLPVQDKRGAPPRSMLREETSPARIIGTRLIFLFSRLNILLNQKLRRKFPANKSVSANNRNLWIPWKGSTPSFPQACVLMAVSPLSQAQAQ